MASCYGRLLEMCGRLSWDRTPSIASHTATYRNRRYSRESRSAAWMVCPGILCVYRPIMRKKTITSYYHWIAYQTIGLLFQVFSQDVENFPDPNLSGNKLSHGVEIKISLPGWSVPQVASQTLEATHYTNHLYRPAGAGFHCMPNLL